MSQSLIGIEINNRELNIAQSDGSGGKLLLSRLPEELMREDRISDGEGLAAFLRDVKQQNGLAGKSCALVLPGNATFFRTINMPMATAEQIRLNLPYEFRDYIGQQHVRFAYDYELERIVPAEENGGEGDSLELLAAAAQKDVVKEYAVLLHSAGLRLKLALPREMALLRLVKNAARCEKPLPAEFSIIDIESDHVHLSIFHRQSMSGFKIIDAGTTPIDEAIASGRGITPAEAVQWRDENRQNILASEACEAVYDQIALEIMKTFNFYRYEHPQSEIGDVYFCGSGSAVKQLTEAIVRDIGFRENDILTLLPEEFCSQSHAKDCAVAIGMTL